MPQRDPSNKKRNIAAISTSVAENALRWTKALRSKKLEIEKRAITNPQSKIGHT
jgi:hypothetical protein